MGNCTVCGENWSRRVPTTWEGYQFECADMLPDDTHYKVCVAEDRLYFHLVENS